MKAAIYARYSSDLQRQASITDQFRACLRVVERDGLELVGKFKDEAMSGANAARPGYQALLEAAQRRDFDVIVVEEVSRLWRDQEEQWKAVKRLEYWGVHIVGVNDGINTRGEGYGLLLSIRGAMNEEGRREIAKRTHRGLSGVALSGHSAGGKCYGYRSVPIEDNTRRDSYGRPVVIATLREVDPEQAKWVRFIFEKYADGWSPRKIAYELNRLQVPPPGASWNRKRRTCKGWAASAIYGDQKRGFGILLNPLYAGSYVWNRTRRLTDPDTKTRKHAPRAKQEWIVKQAPELQIVATELWDRVQARLEARRAKGQGKQKGAAQGHAQKYLFSGLLRCGMCGGNYVIINAYSYGCATHKDRGAHACPNSLKVTRRLVEEKILQEIKSDLADEEFFEEFRQEAARLLKGSKGESSAQSEAQAHRLAQVERELENVLAAIKAGVITKSTKAELEKLEAEREQLLTQSTAPKKRTVSAAGFMADALQRYRRLTAALEEESLRDVPRVREQLKGLIEPQGVRLCPEAGRLVAHYKYSETPLLLPLTTANLSGTEERT